MGADYSSRFYDEIRSGAVASAAAVVPRLFDLVKPARVIDVGAGEGHWLLAFEQLGADVIGLDGSYVTSSPLGDRFLPHDLSTPLPEHLAGRFDLALSLEVAEHLPRARAASFVRDLCQLAPVVVFSAAIPGQGGTGHVNEQWPSYWCDLFEAEGFAVSGALRFEFWNDDRVENWYRQNLLVAVGPGEHAPELIELLRSPLAPPWPLVHPVLYNARRSS